MKKDWKKEVWAQHQISHETWLKNLERLIWQENLSDSTKEELEKIRSMVHSQFDTLVAWVEELTDEILRLEGRLEEARRCRNSRGG
jgi:tellurite resistance protein